MIMNLPQEMASFQTFYLQYDPKYQKQVLTVMSSIQQTYANFRFFWMKEDLNKDMNRQYNHIRLTKRKKTFVVLAPLCSQQNPELLPQGCQRIIISENQLQVEGILVSLNSNWEDVEIELVYRLQLDSVWVGLLYRIGTDVRELKECLIDHERFQLFKISLIDKFYALLEGHLAKQQPFSSELLKMCRQKLVKEQMTVQNSRVQELVRSKFNSRIVINDITMHPYISLLQSRKEQILSRFQTFKGQITQYPSITKILTLNNFIILDDYIFSQFLFGCLKSVKKYLNRTHQIEPYSEIVKKYHKDIIRQFRPSIHQYFLSICLVLRQRAACLKEAVGAIIVKDRNIISTGYNGTPMGTTNCYNGGCPVCNNSQKMGLETLSCRCIHAQYNCILTAGIAQTPRAILYSTKLPCLWCGQIREVIYLKSKYDSLDHDNVALVKKTLAAGKVILREMQINGSH